MGDILKHPAEMQTARGYKGAVGASTYITHSDDLGNDGEQSGFLVACRVRLTHTNPTTVKVFADEPGKVLSKTWIKSHLGAGEITSMITTTQIVKQVDVDYFPEIAQVFISLRTDCLAHASLKG